MVTTIGLDIAKSIFQVHGIDAPKRALLRTTLKQKVTKSSGAVMKQREQAEIVKEGTTPPF